MHRFNDWLAIKITKGVGTMWCAYTFTALALISLPAVITTHNAVAIVAWIAQTFFQLVLLPIIIVGQNLQAKRHDELLHHVKKLRVRAPEKTKKDA